MRRKFMKKRKMQIILAVVFMILGFLLAYQYRQLREPERTLTIQETQDLLHEIEILKTEKESLKEKNQDLSKEMKEYEESVSSTSETAKLIKQELDQSRLLLGLEDTTGTGLVLTLKPTDSSLNPQNFEYLTDIELVYILNELKFAGAEAISINKKRITIQTGIKSSSNNSFILINDEKVSPREEIIIEAVGDPKKLSSAVAFNGAMDYNALQFYDIRFQEEDEVFLGKFEKSFSTDFMEKGEEQ